MAKVIKSWQEGDQRCFACVKRTCPLLVVRTSLSELSRATLVFRCSCSMGNPDRGRVRTGIPMDVFDTLFEACCLHPPKLGLFDEILHGPIRGGSGPLHTA